MCNTLSSSGKSLSSTEKSISFYWSFSVFADKVLLFHQTAVIIKLGTGTMQYLAIWHFCSQPKGGRLEVKTSSVYVKSMETSLIHSLSSPPACAFRKRATFSYFIIPHIIIICLTFQTHAVYVWAALYNKSYNTAWCGGQNWIIISPLEPPTRFSEISTKSQRMHETRSLIVT